MPINSTRARQFLSKGDLRRLFIEELGWDQHGATLQITLVDAPVTLQALAQKRGMVAYHCSTPVGTSLPDYAQRRKIEHQVAKFAHEHLIVFTDSANDTQIWQWVKREAGKPAACREHKFHRGQQGDALLQKLEAIVFTLDEEERLSLTDVTRRARAGFDVERITKRFYDRFQKEHTVFLEFIAGITERADHEWYASVMLNRLMFVYFMQRKGFLDGDRDYLRNRLSRLREEHGSDKFYSFYRYFLLRLFHEGLGGRKRASDLEQLVGRIPYLNGGLFDIHELEAPDDMAKRSKFRMKLSSVSSTTSTNISGIWTSARSGPTTRSIPTSLVTSSRSASTRNRWVRTTRGKTLRSTSASTPWSRSSSTLPGMSAESPSITLRDRRFGTCSKKTRIATFTLPSATA
jgi:hypothetical protein